MSVRIFVISDTHFGHEKTVTVFKRPDGSPLRDFPHVDAMDEAMVERWNAVVRPQDHVYHLGDVAIKRRNLEIVRRLHGHKRLVRGNHDIFRTSEYIAVGFEEIHGVRVFPGMGLILSHIPIHPDSLARWGRNVHGHLHFGQVMTKTYKMVPDDRYVNVAVEMVDYTPQPLEQYVTDRLPPRRDHESAVS